MALRSIQAIFEDGVLKPTEKLDLREHERVRLIITEEAEWQRQFAALLEQVYARTDQVSAEELEADISAAAQEVRASKSDAIRPD
jgi:predicted DNA-binding antitoxin AbrB/MazE fold protein